jgi:hypothetical protein
VRFAFPQLLMPSDLEAVTAKKLVYEEAERESLPFFRTSCPAGAPGPIAISSATELLIHPPILSDVHHRGGPAHPTFCVIVETTRACPTVGRLLAGDHPAAAMLQSLPLRPC